MKAFDLMSEEQPKRIELDGRFVVAVQVPSLSGPGEDMEVIEFWVEYAGRRMSRGGYAWNEESAIEAAQSGIKAL